MEKEVKFENQNIKIVFFDIDWTLYDHKNNCFNEKSIDAIKNMQNKGIKIILCTARPYHSMLHLGTLDLIKPDGYIVSNGGATFLYDELLDTLYFKDDDIELIYNLAKKYHLAMEMVGPKERFLVTPKTKEVDELFSVYKEVIPTFRPYFKGQKVVAALLFAKNEYDEVFLSSLPDNIYYKRYAEAGVDIIPEVRLKSKGVNIILNKLNIKKENALAFGDDVQDISMFSSVGYSICLNNGNNLAKESATYICDDIYNDGVYKALKTLKLI